MVTKLQRQKHINNVLKTLAQNEDFEEDKWGNLVSIDGATRFKPKKSVLRKERKISTGWTTIYSAYFKDIEIREDGIHIIKRIA